ncbi:MAG: hypothetical protein Q9192_001745 [Flavoplaca navasiana]
MQSRLDETTATPKRQSCDRCHSQKLRCTRPDNGNTGLCDRCLRKGAECTYSSCLPKGRPSVYRSSEGLPAPKGPPLRTSCRSSTTPASPASFPPPDLPQGDIAAFSPGGSMGTFVDFPASLWPDDPIVDSMLGVVTCSGSDLEPTTETQTLANLGSSWQSTRNGSGAGQGLAREDGLGPENNAAENISTSTSSRCGHATSTVEKNSFELSVAHLSRLNARLSQLLGLSRRFLTEAVDPSRQCKNQDPALQAQLGIEMVFKSTNAWLVHGSSNVDTISSPRLGQTDAFNLLHHVFSASNHMLEILHHVRVSASSGVANSSATASPSPLGSGLSSGSQAETLTSRSPCDGGHHSYSVVRQLVLICVTLLLNMYETILIALQRSADALNSSRRQRARNSVEPNDHMDGASRTHLQLVSVVQLCSYFIKRQNQTLDIMMLSSQASSWEYDPLQSVSSDAMSNVKIEVEQRLRQLQESISISP